MRKLLVGSAVVAFVGAFFSGVAASNATKPDPVHKVDICHRTASHSNPYVFINVDEASVNEQGGKGDHNAKHEGPIWFPGIEGKWGDIIPPFYDDGSPGYWPSQNWDAEGQAIFYNACNIPEESPSPSPSVTPSPSETVSPSPSETTTVSPSGFHSETTTKTRTKRPPHKLAFTGPPSWVVIGLFTTMIALIMSGLYLLRKSTQV